MSEFKPEPVVVLETMEDVRAAITQPRKGCCGASDQFRIKSLWLISLIDEIVANENRVIAYNSEVKRLAERRLGFPPKTDAEYAQEGDTLSLLIYNAQCYRRSDRLIAAGYVPFTEGLVAEAYRLGKQIELAGGTRLNVRDIYGRLVAMKPRKRSYHILPNGQPAKLVDRTNGAPQTSECPVVV